MAEQAKRGWVNPIKQEHVVGFGVGIVAMAIFSFGYPGWFMSRSAAEEQRKAEVSSVRAEYCLASYLASGVTAAEAAKVRAKATGEQAKTFVETGHAPDEATGMACGKKLDQLSTEAQLDAAIKKATAAAVAREAKMNAGTESSTKQN